MNIFRQSAFGFLPIPLLLSVIGCDNGKRELEMMNAQLVSERDSILYSMKEREEYFQEVVEGINGVYATLEEVRASEEEIRLQTMEQEAEVMLSNDESRQHLLDQIHEIDRSLAQSRGEIRRLESKIVSMGKEALALNNMIDNLKQHLAEREQRIASLEAEVSGLETEIVEQKQLIVQRDAVIESRDAVIESKDTELNTVYYIIGTRSELKEKGIIADEGGFLWGLLGSTSVLAADVDETLFQPFDIRRDHSLTIEGEIEEILPRRGESSFTAREIDEERSHLEILNPGKFWQEKYLVVVKG